MSDIKCDYYKYLLDFQKEIKQIKSENEANIKIIKQKNKEKYQQLETENKNKIENLEKIIEQKEVKITSIKEDIKQVIYCILVVFIKIKNGLILKLKVFSICKDIR